MNNGLSRKYDLVGVQINDCLVDTAHTGNYIYRSGAKNSPESGSGGIILTWGFDQVYTTRICVTTFGTVFTSIYQPGISYGTWQKRG